ncbi:hypothetical protein [Cupriavidus basilensis]|uniref:Uncharacterized protein n=1 Tax=Cupriavidus basilensis TaxID=68895 RepID=A0A0C4YHG6_9BURK|nr:hypothetical protein [Cupriavidus basilensis]AJG21364.1 hypothetical protein RR42_m4015 [Cupriavidus basilensis]
MRFHPNLHLRQMAGRLHWPHVSSSSRESTRPHSLEDDAEVAKAMVYVSVVTLVILLVVLAAIAFGQEAVHWLGVQ